MTTFFVFCRVGSLEYFSWYGSKALHKQMVSRVLNAPVNLYFDTTPIGRILNRFSKDLSLFDNDLVFIIGSALVCGYTLVAIMILSIVVVPWIGLFFPIMIILVVYIY